MVTQANLESILDKYNGFNPDWRIVVGGINGSGVIVLCKKDVSIHSGIPKGGPYPEDYYRWDSDNFDEISMSLDNKIKDLKLNFKIMKQVTFAEAVSALKEGKVVSRYGWNGKGMMVFRQVPAEISADIIPKMQSLPQKVKDLLAERGAQSISYDNQLALLTAENRINGWAPSVSDTLAEDWIILD